MMSLGESLRPAGAHSKQAGVHIRLEATPTLPVHRKRVFFFRSLLRSKMEVRFQSTRLGPPLLQPIVLESLLTAKPNVQFWSG